MLRSLRKSRGVSGEAQLAAGTISVEHSAARIVRYATETLDAATTGQFWAADTGAMLPW